MMCDVLYNARNALSKCNTDTYRTMKRELALLEENEIYDNVTCTHMHTRVPPIHLRVSREGEGEGRGRGGGRAMAASGGRTVG